MKKSRRILISGVVRKPRVFDTKFPDNFLLKIFLPLFFAAGLFLFSCSSGGAVKAEEYYSIGMAYYEMGKFEEAEKWLNRASSVNKTMTASSYQLGRIAFEAGRYEDAARHFERVLVKDPENVMALKAAAYSRIKNGDLQKAEALYNRVLALVPESADDGFNYALVLYGMEKYESCENTLNKYPYALEGNPASILLLARAQKAQDKIEAADTYAKWLTVNTGTPHPQGLYEYAQVLESGGLYARALEQYKAAADALTEDTEDLKKSTLIFERARLLLTVDAENREGIAELNASVAAGFSDTAAIDELQRDERVSKENRDEIRKILNNIIAKEKKEEEKEVTEEEEEETKEEEAAEEGVYF